MSDFHDLKLLRFIDQNDHQNQMLIREVVSLDESPVITKADLEESMSRLLEEQRALNARVEALADVFGLLEEKVPVGEPG